MNKPNKESWSHKLYCQYGPIAKLNLAGKTIVLVSDPEGIGEVFRNEGPWPSRGGFEENVQWINTKHKLSTGLAFSTGATWRKLRSTMSRQVLPIRIANYIPGLCKVSEDLCDHLAAQRDSNGWMNDVFDATGKWSLKGVSFVVFGKQIDVFSGKDAKGSNFVKASQNFNEAHTVISTALPLYKIFPTKRYKFYINSVKNMRRLGRDLLKHHYNDSGTLGETSTVSLLEQWLLEGKMTEEEAISQACDQIAAGVDTTSNTGTFMLHELAKHHDIQEEVRREILDVLGSVDQPTFDDLQKMKLVRACVRETLRLYPTTATIRTAVSDFSLFGYHIPAGTAVAVNFYTCGQDSKYFITPEKFIPSRWLESNKEEHHPFATIPFGFGPRTCYGRRIAELELYLLLVHVLRRFNLSTDQREIKMTIKTVLRPCEPVRIQFDNL